MRNQGQLTIQNWKALTKKVFLGQGTDQSGKKSNGEQKKRERKSKKLTETFKYKREERVKVEEKNDSRTNRHGQLMISKDFLYPIFLSFDGDQSNLLIIKIKCKGLFLSESNVQLGLYKCNASPLRKC